MSDARILIVEDEGIEALDIQRRLISLGYPPPEFVLSGEEAVKKTMEIYPDLVLMDIMLGGEIDGVMAAEQIRSAFDVPIIYLTAYADEDTLRRAKITEPYGYIVKPFKEREVHITIDMALYRHRMERKLRESEKFFATTLRSIGDAVVATDQNGLITFMNGVAQSLMGWRIEDGLGRKLTDIFNLINAETGRPVENPATSVMRSGSAVALTSHTKLVGRLGPEIWVDANAAPIKDDQGNVSGVILVFRDVTERRRFEDALRQKNAELERASLVRENFLASMSHELRTPLNAIIGFAGTLLMKLSGPLTSDQEEQLNTIETSAQHLLSLVADLLDLASIESGRLAVTLDQVSCREVIEEVAALVRPEAEKKGLKFEVVRTLGDARVYTDRRIVTRILATLARDAVKFTGAGHVRLSLERTGDGVEVTVADTGWNVPPGSQALSFGFQHVNANNPTPDDARRRGLYLSQKLAALVGARLDFARQAGSENAFTLTLQSEDSSEN